MVCTRADVNSAHTDTGNHTRTHARTHFITSVPFMSHRAYKINMNTRMLACSTVAGSGATQPVEKDKPPEKSA